MIGRLSLEEIGHVNLVLVVLIVCVGEDVSPLDSLRAESENVIDNEDGRGSG